MNCAQRTSVYALLLGIFVFNCGIVAHAKDSKDRATTVSTTTASTPDFPDEFKWNENRKLSWSDFRGPIKANNEESAAATNCGIGFRTAGGANGKPTIIVYNTFYANRSWVRPDAKISTILDHEQGHFDLCEIYTRRLRERLSNFNFNVSDVKSALMSVYTQVQDEYEARQQAYEQETTHGTNIPVQKRWQATITKELSTANMSIVSN